MSEKLQQSGWHLYRLVETRLVCSRIVADSQWSWLQAVSPTSHTSVHTAYFFDLQSHSFSVRRPKAHVVLWYWGTDILQVVGVLWCYRVTLTPQAKCNWPSQCSVSQPVFEREWIALFLQHTPAIPLRHLGNSVKPQLLIATRRPREWYQTALFIMRRVRVLFNRKLWITWIYTKVGPECSKSCDAAVKRIVVVLWHWSYSLGPRARLDSWGIWFDCVQSQFSDLAPINQVL